MPIIVNLDVMMARRKMSLNELSEKVNLTLANLSVLKTGNAKAIRFSTLDAICKAFGLSAGRHPGVCGKTISSFFLFQFCILFLQVFLYPELNYVLDKCEWNSIVDRKLNRSF